MNINRTAVLEAFEYLLLEEVNYDGLPQEWLDVREKMVPVINEAFCCGCEFLEKKILEKDEFDFIGKEGEYSRIQVDRFYKSPTPLFEELVPIWDTWLKFKPYDGKLFRGTMVIDSKNCNLDLFIELPEEKTIEISISNNKHVNFVEYCALLHNNGDWKKNKIFCDLKHGLKPESNK